MNLYERFIDLVDLPLSIEISRREVLRAVHVECRTC